MKLFRRLLGSTVPAASGQAFEPLESRQLLAADLTVSLGPVTNPLRGNTDKVQAQVIITNVGDETFRASRDSVVELYLSADNTFDPTTDVRFSTLRLSSLSRGSSKRLRLDVPEPKLLNPASGPSLPAGTYNVIARIPGLDSNPDNDVAVGEGPVNVDYNFGQVGRSRVQLNLPMPDGTIINVRINGAGTGSASSIDGHTFITLNSGGSRSELLISSNARGRLTTTIDGLIINDIVKNVIANKITVNGSVIINGGVGSVSLGGLTNGSLSYAATNPGFFLFQRTTFSVGALRDAVVSTDVPIAELNVTSWIDTDGFGDRLVAPSVGVINSLGDFQPSVALSSQTPRDPFSVIAVDIKGRVSGSWNLASGVRRFQVGTVTPDFKATFGGNITDLTVRSNFEGLLAVPSIAHLRINGDLRGGTILAGTVLGDDVLLGGSGSGADNYGSSSIGDVTIRGSMVNSLIAASLNPNDGIYLNGNDSFTGTSSIGRIQIYRELVNSTFAASRLPSTVRILFNNRVPTATNPAFISAQT